MSHLPNLLTISAGLIVIVAFGRSGMGDEAEKPTTGSMLYKQQPRRRMTMYYPDGWEQTDKRPAMVIFRCHIPHQRERFRQMGMVVIEPQTAGVNSGKLPAMTLEEIAKSPRPRHQVEDTKSAIRFIRANAEKLGVDPNRIVATGTSGGGDLALQSAINKAFDDPRDDLKVSSVPDALVLYCPAFDGLDIWFVKMETLLERTKAEAPAFLPLLPKFIKNTTDDYATPRHHRVDAIALAASFGKEKEIAAEQIKKFQEILLLFNQRDWQLLHPVAEAKQMSASRILTEDPLPPTISMYGQRDHLLKHQQAFIAKAKELGQTLEVEVYQGGGHSFMMQPFFQKPSTDRVEKFFERSQDS